LVRGFRALVLEVEVEVHECHALALNLFLHNLVEEVAVQGARLVQERNGGDRGDCDMAYRQLDQPIQLVG